MTDTSALTLLTSAQLRLLERATVGWERLPVNPKNRTLAVLARRGLVETCYERMTGGLHNINHHVWLWRIKP